MSPETTVRPPTVHESDVVASWRLSVTGRTEPLFFARLLAKLAVPAVELRTAHYERLGDESRAQFEVHTTAAWAHLIAARFRRLVGTFGVSLSQGDRA